jgi:isopentenyl diphosphate isomerase/L-lactate dehydrogenase-like FMN-dependent dehydrogenase
LRVPDLFGLAVDGARVVNILRREFEIATALCGRPSIADIDPSLIWR